ncbi:gliding motility-associated C-terminal domain-containing protein, partial [Belliella kenyensis]
RGIRITSYPTGVASIVINGVSYSSGVDSDIASLIAMEIPTDEFGNPTVSISVDPTEDGATTVVIPFVAIDNLGYESLNTGEAILNLNLALEIIANDDDFGVHPVDFGGELGNILANDLLNGASVDISLVDFEVFDLGGLQGLVINADGTLSLIPSLNPAGTYILEYRICEIANPTNCDTAIITLVLESLRVDLSIAKTSNEVEIWEGDEFEYQIRVSNIGGTDATEVVIEDVLPNGVSFQGQSFTSSVQGLQVNFSAQGGRLTWSVPFMPADAVIDITVRVSADALNGTSPLTITNVVTVRSSEEDVNPGNNTDTDVNTVRPFFIPNVITPDGDRRNDTFEIKGINKFVSNEIVIFNRYGDHVYEASNYRNDWGADKLPAGTYYYVFKAKDRAGREHVFKGWIQVMKD